MARRAHDHPRDVTVHLYRRASKRHHFRRITEARDLLASHLKGTAA